jgi:hypothetical protein
MAKALWSGLDRKMGSREKLRQVERAIQRLEKAQAKKDSPFLARLRREANRLRGGKDGPLVTEREARPRKAGVLTQMRFHAQ